MRVFIILASVAVLPVGIATAQEAGLGKVYACAAIADSNARLACFDSAVAGIRQAQAAGDIKVVTREQAAEGAKQAFGLSASAAGAAAVQIETPDRVSVSLTAIDKRADGKSRFTTSDGQVWDQIGVEKVVRKTLPIEAEIRSAALGSFMMKIDGGAPIRVRRVK